ncbi:hypothetical protein GGI35DRAFT_472568 [Trichoderma velutinum]
MTASDSVNDWSCDDNATDAQISDCSTSDSGESQNATFPQQGELRPAGSLPTFVPFARWNPERSYRGGHTLRYNVEWKLFVKNRERAGQSELDIVLSPKDLWKHVLQPKVIEETSGKPWKEGAALFILSVNDRKTKSIKKRYATQAKIEWLFVAKTLQEWGKSFDDEKTLTVEVKLYYEASTNLTGKSSVGKGATARQRADLGAIISEEIAYMGRPAAIRTAYALMRCTGPPCVLNGHDDVPENFRQRIFDEEREWEERRRKEDEKERKRRRRGSSGSFAILPCQQCAHSVSVATPPTPKMVFPTSPLFSFDMPREDVISAYRVWQRSQSRSSEQKAYYDLVEELTIAKGYTLDMIACNQERMCKFYEKHDIPQGNAWNYVCNIQWFGKHHRRAQSVEPVNF